MTMRRGIRAGVALFAASALGGALPAARVAGQTTTRAAAMRGHFDAALEVHAAIIEGDLAAAGARAEALAASMAQEPASETSAPARVAILDAAGAVQRAADVLAAARATADLLNGCGRCHRAEHVAPAFAPITRGRSDTLVDRMHIHRNAADQLLAGLIVPSDEAWRSGARELATAALYDPGLPVDPAVHQALSATQERFHRLATEAVQADDPRARAAFYAQFLAGCADCHTRHRRPR
jgi:hypothetical protein